MATQRHYHDFTIDAGDLLHSNGTTAVTTAPGLAGTVAAVAKVLDFSNADGEVSYVSGTMVVDVSVMDFTTADEQYHFLFELGDAVAFDGVTKLKAAIVLGDLSVVYTGTGVNVDDHSAIGRFTCGVDNEFGGVLYRYARAWIFTAGTSPSVVCTVALVK